MLKYIDISPLISSKTAVFPGDTLFQRDIALSFEQKNSYLLSSITSTVHIGAHADGPNHYHKNGLGIDKRDLNYYMGPCQVIHAKKKPGERIFPEDIKKIKIKAPRILFRTDSFPNSEKWNGDFNSLSPELINYLAKKKVILVGIDTPSVDPADAKDLTTHHAIYKNNFAILEGLVLTKAKPGLYNLIALPLKIKDGDASPVRAILTPQ